MTVLEGNGDQKAPFEEVNYVIGHAADGTRYTIGKVVPPSEEERSLFSKEI